MMSWTFLSHTQAQATATASLFWKPQFTTSSLALDTPQSSAKGTWPAVETNFKMAKRLGSQLFRIQQMNTSRSCSLALGKSQKIVDGRLIFVEVAQTRKPGEDASSR
ncbi:hypothetical protein PanWU01x14_163060 [Parasponia andersonii]|uniref:Uncharacterized protein n=1 Tax=Parasponia andersonii TaxID=3476 RepID=A0A2P5CD98_PARAD|nr:hypothetical protein PanWU01x14_163060 [Parasponia andersonii]